MRGGLAIWLLLTMAGLCSGFELAQVSLRGGQLELCLRGVLDEKARRSILAGVPTQVLYDVRLLRRRPWPLPDRCIFARRIHRAVSYDVLTQEFRVEAAGEVLIRARWEGVVSLFEHVCLEVPPVGEGPWEVRARVRLKTVELPLWLRPLGWYRSLFGGWKAATIQMPRN